MYQEKRHDDGGGLAVLYAVQWYTAHCVFIIINVVACLRFTPTKRLWPYYTGCHVLFIIIITAAVIVLSFGFFLLIFILRIFFFVPIIWYRNFILFCSSLTTSSQIDTFHPSSRNHISPDDNCDGCGSTQDVFWTSSRSDCEQPVFGLFSQAVALIFVSYTC